MQTKETPGRHLKDTLHKLTMHLLSHDPSTVPGRRIVDNSIFKDFIISQYNSLHFFVFCIQCRVVSFLREMSEDAEEKKSREKKVGKGQETINL